MAKILITGAAGYIGSKLIPKLLEEGHEELVLIIYCMQGQAP